MSSASIGSGSHLSEALAIRSCHHTSRPFCIPMLVAFPTRSTTTTFSIEGVPASASSTLALSGTTLPRRHAPSPVTRTLAWASLMRSRSASAEKPPNTTLCGAPILAQASSAMGNSGTIPMYTATRSPFLTPSDFSALAQRLTSRSSIPKVSTRESPGSPSQIIAALLRLADLACRSTQL